MGENSGIAWTDDTFNPWWGCTRVGPGCDNCYAAALDKRMGGNHWDGSNLPRRTKPANWEKPIRWNRAAAAAGVRRKVFCASMADVFDNRIPTEWRADLWALVRETPYLDWIILTKRVGNIEKMLPPDWGAHGYPHVWLLVTVVNQAEADRDIPKLINLPAWVRGLSIEPQLELITLQDEWLDGIHWVITGGESGAGRRPFDDDWARSLRDQCAGHTDMGRPWPRLFFFKQKFVAGKKIETPELDGVAWTQIPQTPLWFPDPTAPLTSMESDK